MRNKMIVEKEILEGKMRKKISFEHDWKLDQTT